MSEVTSAKGVTGGVLGIITAIAGFMWMMVLLLFITDLLNYSSALSFVWSQILFTYLGYAGTVATLMVPYPSSINLFIMSSVMLAVVIFVFGVMIGFGFYKLYSESGSSMGLVYLSACAVGTLVAGMLIAVGGWVQTTIIQISQSTPGFGADFIPLRVPATSYTWIGEIVLGAVLIILGVASIRICMSVERRKSALAAGVLSLICGVVFALHIIVIIFFTGQVALAPDYGFSMMPMLITGYIFSTIFTLVGFGLLLVVSVLWTRVFLASSTSE